jgi:thioredoxin-related protein
VKKAGYLITHRIETAMKNLHSSVEQLANIAIIIIAVLLGAVLTRSYLIGTPQRNISKENSLSEHRIKEGDVVTLDGVNWQKNGRTLVLALSTTCHFCSESAPFYQRVAKERGNTRLIALVPQPASEGVQYLKGLNVETDEVRQAPFGAIGVTGTPTLILVDAAGKAARVWIGALPINKEEEVLNALQWERASK